jgi:cytochrome c oxidase subunit 1
VSEVLPVFSRKPLFGYAAMVFSGAFIAFLGFGVWSHHMFTTGMGPIADTFFSLTTMLIAVPTGVKIFNWVGTLWGGAIRYRTPILFAIGFVSMFIIGGLSGVLHSIVPHDAQQTDTYFIVAHFHYVLFGGALFGIFGGFYYWWPKIFGRLLNERLGKLHFGLMFVGFNMAFFPMHILGLMGMPRRIYTYPDGMGWNFLNMVETVGAYLIAISLLVFIANALHTRKHGEEPGDDPWDGRTLEWSTSSPPPEHNFDELPVVQSRDDVWHRKYLRDPEAVPAIAGGADEHEHGGHGIHLPSPSFFPLIAATGLPILAYGVIYTAVPVLISGAVVLLFGMFSWALEPSVEPE